jgi:hypothetical protein
VVRGAEQALERVLFEWHITIIFAHFSRGRTDGSLKSMRMSFLEKDTHNYLSPLLRVHHNYPRARFN